MTSRVLCRDPFCRVKSKSFGASRVARSSGSAAKREGRSESEGGWSEEAKSRTGRLGFGAEWSVGEFRYVGHCSEQSACGVE